MRNILKLFCLFLTIVVVFNGFNAIAFAEQNVKSNNVVGDLENILLKGDLPLSELKNRQLPNQDKPETVSTKSIDANGHVNRLREQEESLNDIMFQNRDGTKTLYSFSYPVKYVAKDGTIRDKKTNISTTIDKSELKNDYEYANIENDIKTYFPKKLSSSNGVLLEVADVEIEMFPVSSQKATAEKNNVSQKANQSASLKSTYKDEDGEEKDTVVYKDVFGKDTSLRYTSQFDGFKEDIILDKYTGVNEFVFKIKTNGLSLKNSEDGSLILVDPNSNTMVASLGNLMIYDSSVDGNGSDKFTRAAIYQHYYHVAAEKENFEYLVTIHVDDAYLESEATVYPVYVDPTLTVWHTVVLGDSNISSFGNYSNYMQTTYIFEDDESNNGSALMKVGAGVSVGSGEDEQFPDARSLINFNWLTYQDTRNPLFGKQITSAKLYVRDLFPSVSTIKVGLYGVTQNWTTNTVNGEVLWDQCNSTQYGQSRILAWNRGVEAIGHADNQSVGHWYSFDIKEYIKDIIGEDNSYGLMLKVSDPLYENAAIHTIAGATYLGNPSLRPALVVSYNGIVIEQNNITLDKNETADLCINTPFAEPPIVSSSDDNIATVEMIQTSGDLKIRIEGHSNGVATIKVQCPSDASFFARCNVIVSTQNLLKIYVSPANHKKTYSKLDGSLYPIEEQNEKKNMEIIADYLNAYLNYYYVDVMVDKADHSGGKQTYEGRPNVAKAWLGETPPEKSLYLAIHSNAGGASYTVAFHNSVGGNDTKALAENLTSSVYEIVPDKKTLEPHEPISGKYGYFYDNSISDYRKYEAYEGNLGELRENEDTYTFKEKVNGAIVDAYGTGKNIPAILVEVAFHDNPVQANFIINEQMLIADRIAKALINNYNLQPRL